MALSFPDLLSHAAQKCMPRDVGEFVSELVDWLESQAISMTWERRFTAGSKVERPEAGTWQHPIALDCLYELDIPTPTMTQLLQPWIHAESMRSAFTSVGTLKCIYIDRSVMLMPALGHNNLIELEDELFLPFFTDARTIDLTWIPHTPVSAVVHLGSRTSGHFITFLKAWNPPCWYELDDAKKAKMHLTLPTWAKERLVLVWYCPSHAVPDSSHPSASELAAGLPCAPGPLDTEEMEPVLESEHSEAADTEDSSNRTENVSWPSVPAIWTEIDSNEDQQRLTMLLARITDALDPATGPHEPAAEATCAAAAERHAAC